MRVFSCLLTVALFLTACSNLSLSDEVKLYEVRMMNGDSLYTRSKPSLDDDGYYRFNDVDNQRYIVNKNLVLFIEPSKFAK